MAWAVLAKGERFKLLEGLSTNQYPDHFHRVTTKR